jgi:hypothetical protein
MPNSIGFEIVTKNDRPMSAEDRKAIYGFLSAYVKDNEAKAYAMNETGFTEDELSDAFNFKYGV